MKNQQELSFSANHELKNKILGPSTTAHFSEKENEDVFNKLWSCNRECN